MSPFQLHGLPEPVEEHRFHPVRKWRFDFAWPEKKVALEVEGGTFRRGRHTRGAGFRRDIEKYNAATVAGWRVLRYLPEQMRTWKPYDDLSMLLNQKGA